MKTSQTHVAVPRKNDGTFYPTYFGRTKAVQWTCKSVGLWCKILFPETNATSIYSLSGCHENNHNSWHQWAVSAEAMKLNEPGDLNLLSVQIRAEVQ